MNKKSIFNYFHSGFLGYMLLVSGNIVGQVGFDQFFMKETKANFYKNASLGLSIRDAASGKVLYAFHDQKWMSPASSLKVITNLSALDILGKDFTFTTSIYVEGKVDQNGILNGNIIVKGGGDPTLGSPRIEGNSGFEKIIQDIVQAIRKSGIKQIHGDIIADHSIFPGSPLSPTWQWNDIGNYYGGGSWGINILENEYAIFFQRDRAVGSPAVIQYIEPYIPRLEVQSRVIIEKEGSGDQSYIFEGPRQYRKIIEGSIPKGKVLFKVRGAIPDPPLFLAYRLKDALHASGIDAKGISTSDIPITVKSGEKIISFVSPPLEKIVQESNKASVNLYADAILNMMGHVKKGVGNSETGLEVVQEYLTTLGIPADTYYLEDGSGLSARNLVSPDVFTFFLQSMISKKGEDIIRALLPRVGKEGTVKNLLSNSPAKGNVWAKTGSMNHVYSLTGICHTATGNKVVFSMILNGSPFKDVKPNREYLENILASIYKFF